MRLTALILAAAIAALDFAPSPATAVVPATEPAAVRPEVRLDHISIVKLGSGSPVVLMPGLASPRAVWNGVVPELARTHTVYLVQVNGFAGDAPGANLAPGIIDGMVADLHSYLTREETGPVKLIGHSLGGLAGLMFARKHADQVEELMVVDALPFFPVLFARGGEAPTAATVEPMARMMRDSIAARYGKPTDAAVFKAEVERLALKAESRTIVASWAAAADPRVTAQLLYEDLTTDFRPDLAGIKTRITLVYPWSETGFGNERTAAFYRQQYAAAPNSAFVGIADSGHFAMLDQPERFAKALTAFVGE
jgi:pimeloyl-ACP methyl ester carboxylesterase